MTSIYIDILKIIGPTINIIEEGAVKRFIALKMMESYYVVLLIQGSFRRAFDIYGGFVCGNS